MDNDCKHTRVERLYGLATMHGNWYCPDCGGYFVDKPESTVSYIDDLRAEITGLRIERDSLGAKFEAAMAANANLTKACEHALRFLSSFRPFGDRAHKICQELRDVIANPLKEVGE